MADDTQRLIVSLEASITKFENALNKANGIATARTNQIQKTFDSANRRLVAGMSSIGKTALATGDANARLISGMSQGAKTFDAVAEASGHVSTQSQAAFHSLRAMAEGIALGLPPSQVLTQQLNHLTYAASGPGGLSGAFKGVLQIFTGILTPFRLAAGGLIGVGAAAVASAISFSNSQSRIKLSLEGVGNASGITVSNINDIASAVSKTGDISESEAANIASAIASTGKVSADVTKKATGLAHAYSLVFDKSLDDSAKDLGAALADPAKGIDTLNGRLGAWNAKQVELVKNLTLAGNREAAQKIIVEGIQKSIGEAATQTTIWARAWDAVTNSAGNFFSGVGKTINATTLSPQEAFDQAQARVTALQSGQGAGVGRRGLFGSQQEIDAATAALAKAKAALVDYNTSVKEAASNQESVDVSAIVKGVDPTVAKLEELQATIERIRKAPVLDDASEAVRNGVVASLQAQHDSIQKNLDVSREQIGVANEQYALDKKSADLDIAALNARSPLQKAQIAYQQRLNELQNENPAIARAQAQLAFNKSLAESLHTLSEAQRDRVYQDNASVDAAENQNAAIGLSIGASTTLTQKFQLLAAARAEANKNGTVVKPEEVEAVNQAADALGRLAEAQAALNLQKGASFDISQLGRSQSEQNVYGALQGAGLLDNGDIVSQQAKQTAEVLRTKEALTQLADVEKGFASDFLHDLIQGKSAAQALGDALTNIANKLLDLGISSLVSLGTKSLTGAITGGLGFADGGIFVPGKGRQPLKRFAGGGVSNQAAIFGEAGPEAAIPLKGGKVPVDLRMPTVAPSSQSAPNINISIDARNSTPQAVDDLNNTTLPELKALIRSEVMQTANRSAAFKKVIRR